MRALLTKYRAEAIKALDAAKTATAATQATDLKAAIEAITKLAQEGDNTVMGIKNTLRQGGHHHNKEEGSTDEYIFVNGKARKALMDDAQKLRDMVAGGKQATAADLDPIQKDVNTIADEALARLPPLLCRAGHQ